MKKILIFGPPRSGTTILQSTISQELQLANCSEPYNQSIIKLNNPYNWTANLHKGVVKLLSFNLHTIHFEKLIREGKFDSIVVTKRDNLVDCCVSLHYATLKNKFHYTISDSVELETFTIPRRAVDLWVDAYNLYKIAVKYLDNNSIPYTLFDYDNYINNIPQIINGLAFTKTTIDNSCIEHNKGTVYKHIPYSELCLNYDEVKKIINATLLRNN